MNIGLIGAENSHTLQFCKSFNQDNISAGNRVTHVFGDDSAEAAAKLAADYGLTICDTEADLLDACDGVVITYRCGHLHYAPTMRALAAGKAVFNDKPFATNLSEAKEITTYAKDSNPRLTGGSILKSLPELSPLKAKLQPGDTVVISYGADPASPYDGYWFYGIHSVEICLALFGTDYKSVSAMQDKGSVVAAIAYADRQCVIVTRPDTYNLQLAIVGNGRSKTVAFPDIHAEISAVEFAKMLETGAPLHDFAHFTTAVQIMETIIMQAGLCNK